MLILKMNLPEVKVNYNHLGACTSELVPYTPDKIKGIQLNLEVTGYQAEDNFFAFKLQSPDKVLTTGEQFSLLSRLGFKTVPVERNPTVPGAVNSLIHTKSRFAKYGAHWEDIITGEVFDVPEVAVINDVFFKLDEHRRLARVLKTDLGEFNVVDHRIPEFYQPGSTIKIDKGVVEPYLSVSITVDTPINCPVCNNPLKKFQVAPDTPIIYKCKAPFCLRLGVSEETTGEIEEEQEEELDNSFRNEVTTENPEFSVSEEPIPESVDSRIRIINFEVSIDSEKYQQKVNFVSTEPADYILVNTKRSVTKASREKSKETGIPLLPLVELEAMLDG